MKVESRELYSQLVDSFNNRFQLLWPKMGGLVFLGGLVLAGFAYRPQFFNSYCVNDDVRQHTFWTSQYNDPELFVNNPYIAYNKYYSTPFFKGLYKVFVSYAHPFAVGKLLGAVLLAASVWLMFLLGENLWNDVFGVLCALCFLVYPDIYVPFSGGLQRSFGIPLLLLFLVLCGRKKFEWTGYVLAAQMGFYPVVAALSIGVLVSCFVLEKWEASRLSWGIFMSGLLGFLLVLVAMGADHFLHAPIFLGTSLNRAQILSDPSFSASGRFLLEETHVPFLPNYIWKLLSKDLYQAVLFLSGLAAAIQLYRILSAPVLKKFIPLLSLGLWSLVMYLLADWLMPHLFISIRYLSYALMVVVPVMVALSFGFLIFIQGNEAFRKIIIKASLLILLGAGLFKAFAAARYYVVATDYGNPETVKLIDFLKKSSKGALIAADPFVSDTITTFAQRSCYLTYELAHPWYTDYRKMYESRTKNYYRAIFDPSLDAVRAFVLQSQTDYLVLNKRYYRPRVLGWQRFFFDPVDSELKSEFKFTDPARSVLFNLRNEHRIYESDDFIVFLAKGI